MSERPISVIKDGKSYPVEDYQKLDRPFYFETSGGSRFYVGETDLPIFFKRKRMKVKKGKVVSRWLHRFCVGSLRDNHLQNAYWIKPDGTYDKVCKEELKIK